MGNIFFSNRFPANPAIQPPPSIPSWQLVTTKKEEDQKEQESSKNKPEMSPDLIVQKGNTNSEGEENMEVKSIPNDSPGSSTGSSAEIV